MQLLAYAEVSRHTADFSGCERNMPWKTVMMCAMHNIWLTRQQSCLCQLEFFDL
jgi:hypothetical protein